MLQCKGTTLATNAKLHGFLTNLGRQYRRLVLRYSEVVQTGGLFGRRKKDMFKYEDIQQLITDQLEGIPVLESLSSGRIQEVVVGDRTYTKDDTYLLEVNFFKNLRG